MGSDTKVSVKAEDVRQNGRLRTSVADQPVVVFHHQEGFVAYVDVCPHQGGPVCSDGSMHPYLTAEIQDNGRVVDVWAPGGDQVLACPWHGWEFWLANGELIADPSKRLRKVQVEEVGEELLLSL